MIITELGVANYRSIGLEPVIVDVTQKVTLLVGANNSGKSNILRFLGGLHGEDLRNYKTSDLDRHMRQSGADTELFVSFCDAQAVDSPDGKGSIHLSLNGNGFGNFKKTPFDELDFRQFGPYLKRWSNKIFNKAPSDEELKQYKAEACAYLLQVVATKLPKIIQIPEFRRIVEGKYSLDGSGAIVLLADWKSPAIGSDSERNKFVAVQDFLKTLLGVSDITLDVPGERNCIIVERGDFRLPLEHYGTGIHQLIILAIAVLSHEKKLISIEEPELHLHPLLQKELLKFLLEKTENNYLISTHSNTLLSKPKDCSVIHLWQDNKITKSRRVVTSGHVLEVLSDLGIRPADILQSNFVIWVEGPSDRSYLVKWLSLVAPELTETIDYSVMFYGGKLLSHLSLEREDEISLTDLIKILKISQHSAVIIDSDKRVSASPINETKQRIAKECAKSDVFCWITLGREIENYLPDGAIFSVFQDSFENCKPIKLRQYEDIERVTSKAAGSNWKKSRGYDANKTLYARKIIEYIPQIEDKLDLTKCLQELVKKIRNAQ